ncbi:uncharacterized protein LOC109857017 isoform X2 [Pseudomyrmex gracilis]|uniref:uncharacterized protein LOC109857017 isoform X2 n=1 Tax=Pseudomyrmex gracilis TaxID=219809 RepID=UPI000995ABDF|nr:uncharacterized protein LOC109857017 isoform X2 [Pseudomyrmex gracilis]XP_020288451.1 uncharacterized protein LOC109857017 isoform X2 [Pseudomyrmex gracilis]
MYNTRNMSVMPIVQETDSSNCTIIIFVTIWLITFTTALSIMQWEHMWIVLVALTIIFLLACIYHACKVKKVHEERLREHQRITRIRTVSGLTDHGETDYRTQPNMDSPPSYSSVVSAREPPLRHVAVTIDRSGEEKVEEPPSYSLVIGSTILQNQNATISSESNVLLHSAPTKKEGVAGDAATSDVCVRNG